MIRKFSQFINEAYNDQRPLSVHETINKPFAEFIENAQERMDAYISRINKLLNDMDIAIETTREELADVIVGEPTIKVDKYLSDITVDFQTNVPNNDEAWDADDSPALDLEQRVNNLLDIRRNEVRAEIYYKPNEEGNCIITLSTYVIDEENFGDFTEVLSKLGE
jgi:hypothetical protein